MTDTLESCISYVAHSRGVNRLSCVKAYATRHARTFNFTQTEKRNVKNGYYRTSCWRETENAQSDFAQFGKFKLVNRKLRKRISSSITYSSEFSRYGFSLRDLGGTRETTWRIRGSEALGKDESKTDVTFSENVVDPNLEQRRAAVIVFNGFLESPLRTATRIIRPPSLHF